MLFKKLFYCTLGSTLLSGVVGLAMAYQGYGVWSLVGQQVVNQFATTLIMWFTIKWRPILVFSFLRFKRLFDFGWKIFLANLIIVVYEDVRSLIIGKVYQPVTLAFFDRGKQLPGLMMTNVNISLQTILLPAFANIQDDPQRVKQMTKRSIELTNFVIMPLLVGLLVAAKPFVLLLLTEKWLGVVPFIQIFCIAYMMIPIQSSNMSAIKALGHSGITLKIEIIKKVIEAVILLVSFLIDVYAVAWGIVLYNFICIIVNLYPCRKLLDYGLFEQLKDVELELPIVFDWENFGKFQNYEMSFRDLNKLYDVFEKEVTSRGYKSMLYGSSYYLRTLWKHLDTRPVWLAVYADWPTYQYPYEFWQVSDHGTIDGIDGYVDFNIQFVMP